MTVFISEPLNHSFNQFVQNTDWLINKWKWLHFWISHWIVHTTNQFSLASKKKVFLTAAIHFSTQAHWKYVPLNTFLQHRYYVPYCRFRGSFKVKCPGSGAKTTRSIRDHGMFLIHWYRHIFLRFYYAAWGTYCGCSEFQNPGSAAEG